MEKVGLSEEIKNLELIIDDLAAGREECEISDPQNTLEDALEFLRDYLQELKDLDQQIAENGNTPEMLKAVHCIHRDQETRPEAHVAASGSEARARHRAGNQTGQRFDSAPAVPGSVIPAQFFQCCRPGRSASSELFRSC